jgi:hypothetical protein
VIEKLIAPPGRPLICTGRLTREGWIAVKRLPLIFTLTRAHLT